MSARYERRVGEFSRKHSQKHSAARLDKSETATAEHDKDSSEPCESPTKRRLECQTDNGEKRPAANRLLSFYPSALGVG